MPRDSAIIFSDLTGNCTRLDRLIKDKDRGPDGRLVDWFDEITVDCPKKTARNWSDQCEFGDALETRNGSSANHDMDGAHSAASRVP